MPHNYLGTINQWNFNQMEINQLGRGDGRVHWTAASLGTILSAAQRRAFKFSLRREFENLFQLFFGAYKLAAIVLCLSSCVCLT